MFSLHRGNSNFRAAHCGTFEEYECPVQNGLAMTASQMYQMAAQGTPISSQQLGNTYSDGSNKVTFDVPLDQKRGVDIGDIWEAAQTSKKRIKKYYKTAKAETKGVENG